MKVEHKPITVPATVISLAAGNTALLSAWFLESTSNDSTVLASRFPISAAGSHSFVITSFRLGANPRSHGFPCTSMSLARAHKSMGYFMKDGVQNLAERIEFYKFGGQADALLSIRTAPKTALCIIKLENPLFGNQTVFVHQLSC
jgi:hypothetical protein